MTIDEARHQLTQPLLEFVVDSQWDVARSVTKILEQMTQTSYWREVGDQIVENDKFPSLDVEKTASRAALFLRDEHLRTTGQRIWGLTFTLYPTGKFKIEYDYNKPEEYDEADALESPVPVSDALGSLMAIGVHVETNESADATPEQPFLRQALSQLQTQTASNSKEWGLGTEAQWNLDMNAGTLRFSFANGHVLDAPVQVVGTYNTKNGTFLWGWDHPSVPQPLRRAAQRVHDYGVEHGLERFTTRSIECTQDEAWEFAAAAAKLDSAAGAYRGDASGTWVYMTFDVPVVVKQSQ